MKFSRVVLSTFLLVAVTFPLTSKANNSANVVPNGDFEAGGRGDPFIPRGWQNAEGEQAFRAGELKLRTSGSLSGGASLEINTTGSGDVSRKLYTRLALDAATAHRVSFRAEYLDGDYVSISVRNSLDGSDTSFIQAVGDVTLRGAVTGRGRYEYSHYFDSSRPYLVIQARGGVHVVLDDISIVPLPGVHPGTGSHYQHVPWSRDWQKNILSGEIMTPHTKWANPLIGGDLKVVSLLPRWWHRWTVELAQRLSMSYEPVMFATQATRPDRGDEHLGFDYWVEGADGEPEIFRVEREAIKQLAGPVDCVVIGYLSAPIIRDSVAEAVLSRVEEGAGLVIIGYGQPYRNLPLEAYHEGVWSKALNENNRIDDDTGYISSGLMEQTQDEFYSYGAGRIAFLRSASAYGLKPQIDSFRREYFACRAGFEAEMSYIIKAVLWASGRMPGTRISAAGLPGMQETAFRSSVSLKDLPDRADIELSLPLGTPAVLEWWFDDYSGNEFSGGRTEIAAGGKLAEIEIPQLWAGNHWLHLRLKSPEGNIIDWNSAVLEVSAEPGIREIRLGRDKPPYYTVGESIEGTVVLDSPAGDAHSLLLRLKDADGHIWEEREIVVTGREAAFRMDIRTAVVLMHTIEAELTGPSGIKDIHRKEVVITREDEWYKDTYDFQLWQIPWDRASTYNYLATLVSGELRKHGITSAYRGNSRINALSNIRTIPITGHNMPSPGAALEGDKGLAPERSPCLSDPRRLRAMEHSYIEHRELPAALPYAPLAYEVGHEVNLLGYGRIEGRTDPDICFSEYCLESFRDFIREEYTDLQALNKSWGTDIRSWEDVRPVVLAEALGMDQIPRWIDHRRHMDRVFTDFWRFKIDSVRRQDPAGKAIFDNAREPTSYSGVDYWLLLDSVGAGSATPHLREFSPCEDRHLTWGRYAYWHMNIISPDDDIFRRRIGVRIWGDGLLAGLGGSSFWEGFFNAVPERPWFRHTMAPDLRTTQEGKWSIQEIAQIRSGIDRLIFDSKLNDSGIGILYSRSSEHAATAWQAAQGNGLSKQIHPSARSRKNQFELFASILRSLGYGYSAVSEQQVYDGILAKENFRLLIMPFSQAIDVDAASAIEDFVAGGGMVLADVRPAVADRHGNTGERGLLDGVFGVKHDTGWRDYTPEKTTIRLNGKAMEAILGPPLEALTAESAGRKDDRPVMLLNSYGEGKAALLNFAPVSADENTADMVERLINWGGRVEPLFGVETVRRNYPGYNIPVEAEAIEVERMVEVDDAEVYMMAGAEGMERPRLAHFINGGIHSFALWYSYLDKIRGAGLEVVRVKPPVAGHIYNLRNNEYLGRHETFEAEMPLEDVLVYAVLPYEIGRPVISILSSEISEGNPVVECRVSVSPAEADAERHVVRVKLFSPDGSEWQDFAKNIVLDGGEASCRFILPVNIPAGAWRVEAREAISGLSASATVKLSPTK